VTRATEGGCKEPIVGKVERARATRIRCVWTFLFAAVLWCLTCIGKESLEGEQRLVGEVVSFCLLLLLFD
jgi:hypothetical protein